MKKEYRTQIVIEEVLNFFSECDELFELSQDTKKEIIDNAINSLSGLKLSENSLRIACQEWLSEQEYKLGGLKMKGNSF